MHACERFFMVTKLEEIVNIAFPKPLAFDEVEQLLEFIGHELLQAKVTYDPEIRKTIDVTYDGVAPIVTRQEEIVWVAGSIIKGTYIEYFSCYKNGVAEERFRSINLLGRQQHPQREEIRGTIRKAVNEYFTLKEMQAL